MNHNILRVEENGVEFFTVIGTGESGLTGAGIAKSLGVARESVSNLCKIIELAVSANDLPDSLKPLFGKSFYCQVKYKNSKIYTSEAWACFAEYYAYEAKRKTKEALLTFRSFARIGAESFIQGITKWLPKEYQSSVQSRSVLEQLILLNPKQAELHFDRDWQKAASRVTGYDWDGMPMARFIRRAVYDWFPVKLIERLIGVNPYNSDGKRRQNYHYQHFCVELDEALLKTHIRDVYNLMCISQSQKHFWQLMRDRFGQGIQLDLDID